MREVPGRALTRSKSGGNRMDRKIKKRNVRKRKEKVDLHVIYLTAIIWLLQFDRKNPPFPAGTKQSPKNERCACAF